MKKTMFSLLFLGFALMVKAQQALTITPAKPVPGGAITLKFDPKNTNLSGLTSIEGYAYLLEGKLPLVQAVTLKKEGDAFIGSVKTNDTTKAVFFSFSNEDIRENNNDEGYYTLLYDKKGMEVQGANLALGTAFSSYASIWGLKRNTQKGAAFNKKEFETAASKEKFYNEYFTYLAQSTEPADKELLKSALQKHMARTDLSETDLEKVKSFYNNQLKDKEQGEAVTALIKQRFPEGNWKRTEQILAFNKEKNLFEKAKIFDQITANYKFGKDDQFHLDRLASMLAQKFADTADYKSMFRYAGLMNDRNGQANVLNSIAWKMSGQGVYGKPGDLASAKEISQRSLDLIQQELKSPSSKPSYLTAKEYEKNLNGSYYGFLDTYATLLYHSGEYEKAYELQKKVVKHFKGKNISNNETFAVLTEKVKGPKEAQEMLEQFLAEGKYTPKMKDQLKTLYLAQNKNEEQWVQYAGGLEVMAFNKLKADLVKKMINQPAPDFKLKDMTGKEVSLSSLKGKTVIVDFWATWCGPCLASFPGMQKAVDKFKNNPNVVFLFIDTWEGGDDREKKVKSFIEKNNYSFAVLYDETKKENPDEFSVVSNFKVDGIPTKFVVDRNNNIRFKSVGYHGSTDGLVNELTAMIDILASEPGTNTEAKKAF
jgi:peroxiredoxin